MPNVASRQATNDATPRSVTSLWYREATHAQANGPDWLLTGGGLLILAMTLLPPVGSTIVFVLWLASIVFLLLPLPEDASGWRLQWGRATRERTRACPWQLAWVVLIGVLLADAWQGLFPPPWDESAAVAVLLAGFWLHRLTTFRLYRVLLQRKGTANAQAADVDGGVVPSGREGEAEAQGQESWEDQQKKRWESWMAEEVQRLDDDGRRKGKS